MILCDIKKEEILSHKILRIKENENRKDKNANLENKLKENAEEIYQEAYKTLKNHLDYKSVLAEYRNLRQSIENNRTYEEASNLYTMEMELKKEFSENIFERLAIMFYGWISDYGESIQKPIIGIIAFILFFPLFALLLNYKLNTVYYLGNYWDLVRDTTIAFFQLSIDKNHFMKNWEVVIRVASLLLLGNLYIAVRRKLSRK